MNDSNQNKEPVGMVTGALLSNIMQAAELMARSVAVVRCMAPNTAEADKMEGAVLGLFHDLAEDMFKQLNPTIQAQLAIKKAEAMAKQEVPK